MLAITPVHCSSDRGRAYASIRAAPAGHEQVQLATDCTCRLIDNYLLINALGMQYRTQRCGIAKSVRGLKFYVNPTTALVSG